MYDLIAVGDTDKQTAEYNSYGSLVKRLRRRPLTAKTGVRFPYELLNRRNRDKKLENSIITGFHSFLFIFLIRYFEYVMKTILGGDVIAKNKIYWSYVSYFIIGIRL